MFGRVGGSLLAALTAAAQAASHFEEEEERQRIEAERLEALRVPINHNITPEGRLAAVLEVNRVLHSTLSEKKAQLEKSRKEAKHLEDLLDRRTVEEPARRQRIEELQASTSNFEKLTGHDSREARQMTKSIHKMEGQVSNLNNENLVLSDRHRVDRTRMTEQQARLRTLGKRERELAKHLDYLASKLNQAVKGLTEEQANNVYGHAAGGIKMPHDFRNLPGLRLNKLVGKEAPPPQLVLAAGATVPTVAPSGGAPSPGPAETEGDTTVVQEGQQEAALDE